MATLGHWLHFGYEDMLRMDTATLMSFLEETERLAKSG